MPTSNIKLPMTFSRLFQRQRYEAPARTLYETIVQQSRRPELYANCGIPDNLPGRFDAIAMHAWLIMRRLKASEGDSASQARALSQALFDLMFADMDHNLREMGVGDLSVGKKIKAMAQGFYGRVAAYDAGMAQPSGSLPDALDEALRRNLFATGAPSAGQVAAMARYLRAADSHLAGLRTVQLLEGQATFPDPPAVD